MVKKGEFKLKQLCLFFLDKQTMNFIDRVKNKVFKAYFHTQVDYHANGFFVRKEACYLIFDGNGNQS